MPRPKGSKNKVKIEKIPVDYDLSIAEVSAGRDALASEIESITANINSLREDLKAKKKEFKSTDKRIAGLQAKKAKADQKAAEEAAEKAAIDIVKKALAEGTSADEIMELLK